VEGSYGRAGVMGGAKNASTEGVLGHMHAH
jgi:hypothetical protein